MERDWEDYKHIAISMAYKFSPSLGEPVEDLIQEGFLYFWKLANDESQISPGSSFAGALSMTIRQNFLNAYKAKHQAKRSAELVDYADFVEAIGTDAFRNMDVYLDLPKELKELADIIIDAPPEFLKLIREEALTNGIRKYLRTYKNWSFSTIKKVFAEIGLNSV